MQCSYLPQFYGARPPWLSRAVAPNNIGSVEKALANSSNNRLERLSLLVKWRALCWYTYSLFYLILLTIVTTATTRTPGISQHDHVLEHVLLASWGASKLSVRWPASAPRVTPRPQRRRRISKKSATQQSTCHTESNLGLLGIFRCLWGTLSSSSCTK